ncbi:hypothetical protein K0M31_002064 [Melipona bicolor]|uniref:Uncharacterized protein n=1 Tax=Melipona bicolor TaxID=60889 RepID=A0AA40GHV3_9HYME|nr:hypothetical protein K0M31_002064 [Melipona bicolor]
MMFGYCWLNCLPVVRKKAREEDPPKRRKSAELERTAVLEIGRVFEFFIGCTTSLRSIRKWNVRC